MATQHTPVTLAGVPAAVLALLAGVPWGTLFAPVRNGQVNKRAYFVAALVAVLQGKARQYGAPATANGVQAVAHLYGAWYAATMLPHAAKCNGACFTKGNTVAPYAAGAGITVTNGKVAGATAATLALAATRNIPCTASNISGMLATVSLYAQAKGMPAPTFATVQAAGNTVAYYNAAKHGAQGMATQGYAGAVFTPVAAKAKAKGKGKAIQPAATTAAQAAAPATAPVAAIPATPATASN